mgnify:FL=1
MFGKRADGRRLKKINPIFLLMPHIMKRRSDAQVFYSQEIPIAPLDEYIAKKDAEGIKMSYMAIIYASLVRIIAEKPLINRFVMNGKIYARNSIDISLVIKKGMSETADETPLKLHFDGSENIFDIRNRLEQTIIQNKEVTAENATDKLAKTLSFVPSWLIKFIVNFLMFLDRHDLLPKFIIEASPFHTSAFLTNVGSLGIDSIYHHLYDFGTTGVFLAMGKKKKSLINVDEALAEEKTLSLRWVLDERICDGYYYANSFKTLFRYLRKPELLETKPEFKQDVD